MISSVFHHSAKALTGLFILLTLGSLLTAKETDTGFEDNLDAQRKFSLFGRAAREGAEAQWVRCNEYVNQNKIKKAIKHCGYLVDAWPDHALANDAQRLKADLLFAQGEFKDAFDAYQFMITDFSGRFDYDAVIQQQLETARKIETETHTTLFGFSHYTKPSNAIPHYRTLMANAPEMVVMPEIGYRIGEIMLEQKKYEEALTEFEQVEQRYPNTPTAIRAAFQRAQSYIHLAKKNKQDARAIENAWAAVSVFLSTYPGNEFSEKAYKQQQNLHNQLAAIRFKQAEFYEVRAGNRKAALVCYEALTVEFPDSDWTLKAKSRIDALSDPSAEETL